MDLPAEFGQRMRNVEIVVDDEPLTERGYGEPYLPDRISIYRGPIQRMSTSPRRQAQIVRDTVMHEIAHHFGISDERLADLGRGDAD
jgi:predicted Zn-dependent protease with MMP-like domain